MRCYLFFAKPFCLLSFCLLSLALPFAAHAADIPAAVKERAQSLGLDAANIAVAPLAGLYELRAGAEIYYLSADGRFLVSGEIINLDTRENVTEARLKGVRLEAIRDEGENVVAFAAAQPAHTINVFTDVDCGYCRKLHAEMAQYNELGITIRYLFFPRAGLGTASYKTAVSVWCDADRQDAMTRAKAGEALAEVECENPVARHFTLGQTLGVAGTPAIVTEQGDLLPGYLPPAAMKQQLDRFKAAAAR